MKTLDVKHKSRKDPDAQQRVALALKLRAQKMSYDQIAAMCGYASRGAAHNAVHRELKRVIVENVDELRREELATLEQLQIKCSKLAFDESYRGRLFAVDRILQIMERRAKLMGLDQKMQLEHSGTINGQVEFYPVVRLPEKVSDASDV